MLIKAEDPEEWHDGELQRQFTRDASDVYKE